MRREREVLSDKPDADLSSGVERLYIFLHQVTRPSLEVELLTEVQRCEPGYVLIAITM